MEYNQLKDDFISNNFGSSTWNINNLSFIAVNSFLLYSVIVKRFKLGILGECFVLFTGQFLAVSILNSYLNILNFLIIFITSIITLFFPIKRSHKSNHKPSHKSANSITTTDFDNSTSWKSQPPSPLPLNSADNVILTNKSYITNYRSYLLFFTMLSILAVDFRVFPKHLSKTESFGTSFMDLGVGSFTLAFGLVDARYHLLGTYNTRKVLPLVLLAIVRLISVTLTNYPQHSTEYGTHWNFFLTLAALPLLTKPLTIINNRTNIQFSWMAIIIAVLFQFFLSHSSLQEWTLNAQRTSLISHNKEGLVSTVGYLCIYLFGLDIGLYSLPQHPYAYFRNRLTKKVATDKRDKLLIILASFSILYWSLFGCVRVFDMSVSRRIVSPLFILTATNNSRPTSPT